MKRFDKLTLAINTPYGKADVEFTIIDILAGFKLALVGQHRVIVIEYKSKNSWKQIGETVDLYDIKN